MDEWQGAKNVLKAKQALLLDMNSTFMFGEDRFGEEDDFAVYYHSIGGSLAADELTRIIMSAYHYLDKRYPDERYRHNFPTLQTALENTLERSLPAGEEQKIMATFAFHELGHVPQAYIDALYQLQTRFTLAVVIDIWSPKQAWLETFDRLGINELFAASSFSSDHGMVKPSPRPFKLVLDRLGIQKEEGVVIGDSVRRDLGGAQAAGLDCILVGGASDARALASLPSLLDVCAQLADA